MHANDQVAVLLSKLADQLGTTAAHLWAVLIRQAAISAWTDVALYALLAASTIAWLRLFGRFRYKKDIIDFPTGRTMLVMAAALAMAVLWIVAVWNVPWTVTKLANPEFYALNETLRALGR